MNNNENLERTNYWDTLRRSMISDDYVVASVLLNETRDKLQNMNDDESIDTVYTTLLEVADHLRVRNPFIDKDSCFIMYKRSKGQNKHNVEEAIARSAKSSRMPLLPAALINLYAKRFSINPKTVLIAEAEKFVPNLYDLVNASPNTHFTLSTQNAIYEQALKYLFEGYDNVEVILVDIYRYEFINDRFDLILSCPIFGGRTLADDQNFMCREFDAVALENLLLHLNVGGRLVTTMSGRITFASGRINDLRQFIQRTYTIKEIGELPEGIIEHSGIKVYLIDIENNRPSDDDIVIRRYSTDEKKYRHTTINSLDVSDDTFIMVSELEEQGNWSIDRIFSEQDEEYLKFRSSETKKETMCNVAQVFRGKAINKKDPTGNIGVVNISNIEDYEINFDELDHIQEEDRKVSNFLLQEGDVLLPARGTVIRVATFHEKNYPCIASSNIIVIRPDSKRLNSTYLKIFLDSPIGRKIINSVQQGVGVMNISYKDLSIMEIPLPSIEEQQSIAIEYDKELTKYKKTIAAAESRWANVLERLQKF